jgi:hypothetical protein
MMHTVGDRPKSYSGIKPRSNDSYMTSVAELSAPMVSIVHQLRMICAFAYAVMLQHRLLSGCRGDRLQSPSKFFNQFFFCS